MLVVIGNLAKLYTCRSPSIQWMNVLFFFLLFVFFFNQSYSWEGQIALFLYIVQLFCILSHEDHVEKY